MDNPLGSATGRAISGNVNAYEELAATFMLDGRGLTIHGQCGRKQNGVVMRSGDEVLLVDSNRGPAPVVALLRMLVPDSRVQVPATRQTDWLLNLLPVPDIVPGDPQRHRRAATGRERSALKIPQSGRGWRRRAVAEPISRRQ